MDPNGNAWYNDWGDFKSAVSNAFSGFSEGARENADLDSTITLGTAGAVGGAFYGGTAGVGVGCGISACTASAPFGAAGAGGGALIGGLVGGGIGLLNDFGQILVGGINQSIQSVKSGNEYNLAIQQRASIKAQIDAGEVEDFVYHRLVGSEEKTSVRLTGFLGRLNYGRQSGQPDVEAFFGPLPPDTNGYTFKTPAIPTGVTNKPNGLVIQWGEDAIGSISVDGYLNAIPVNIID